MDGLHAEEWGASFLINESVYDDLKRSKPSMVNNVKILKDAKSLAISCFYSAARNEGTLLSLYGIGILDSREPLIPEHHLRLSSSLSSLSMHENLEKRFVRVYFWASRGIERRRGIWRSPESQVSDEP